ncbi:MAG: hypothetical protein ACI9EF_002845, partial [Pseudohongiellaceae bacterium]
MATLLAVSLFTALWLMDATAPQVQPGDASSPPVVIPVVLIEQPVKLPPGDRAVEPEPASLAITAEPEVFVPTRFAEEVLLDLDEEIERLGIADVDPDARALIDGQVLDGQNLPQPLTMVTLFDQRGRHITASFSDDEGRFHFESSVPLLAGWSVSTAVVPTLLPDDPSATAPASYRHPADVRPG